MKQEILNSIDEIDDASEMEEADEIYDISHTEIKSSGNVKTDLNRMMRALKVNVPRRKKDRLLAGLKTLKEYADPKDHIKINEFADCVLMELRKYKIDWSILADSFPEKGPNEIPYEEYHVYEVTDIFGNKDVLLDIESQLEDIEAGF
jgi:hypothetical protein